MTRYKDYFQKMLDENKNVFDEFTQLHDRYALDNEGVQDEFNEKGIKILEIIRIYEDKLCSNTERGMYIRYSGGLAEKFQEEIRKHFPFIDHIGLRTANSKSFTKPDDDSFKIKKINFS